MTFLGTFGVDKEVKTLPFKVQIIIDAYSEKDEFDEMFVIDTSFDKYTEIKSEKVKQSYPFILKVAAWRANVIRELCPFISISQVAILPMEFLQIAAGNKNMYIERIV